MVASEPEDDVQKNSPPPMENNDDNAPSKRFYRQQVWTTMKALFPQGSASSNYVNRKIPLFPAAEQTAERLAETPEFKQATNIKVNIDMAQEAVKLQVLKANKTLFVAPSQKSDYLYAKIKLPSSVEEVPLVQQRRIVKMLAGEDTYEELGIDQTEPLDMVVVGCVAVSERGQRIGKGNGYVDLEIAILVQLGVITPKTVIATTVADEQVFSELQADLFQPYDFTVDLIVTPTRVIRVEPRPEPRAIGVVGPAVVPPAGRGARAEEAEGAPGVGGQAHRAEGRGHGRGELPEAAHARQRKRRRPAAGPAPPVEPAPPVDAQQCGGRGRQERQRAGRW
uniref:5-formyltetrahydrofolate cyclo-ligase n=1 Tax=Anopheles coluzzii TaxID=1518534 RepID=A0A6E8V2C7_ANOCL